ncbi:aldose epimerase family protein [Burkholderia cenocepacia]|uniref:hypothetical protein n=1 Tax=Burkholderia cenocepacia TaxID=95486 RepID=UPI00097BFE66|nr:hypothetical protein [Burkholderia cenocepacia]AQQ17682.1 hypothetical protein A8D61_04045 [Burkholderia cenocepacia]AQQ21139.1 hypothetical protein A8D61_23160 [Burkholderia cenocepacia]ONJ15627.1 hypothetical protein A8D82_19095 [Burkholderia cenocepacia]ONJ18045.1 hypothetical protein A8D82_32580 [Burkholderia cenocepacia]ONN85646.1 hypothetical protein A8D62_25770 [Burkholderia cenocepacia]
MFLYSVSTVIKPQWAYIWEYGFQGEKNRLRTPVELTKREFEHWIDEDPRSVFLVTSAPIEATRIDRNRVPLTDPRFKLRPEVPEFDAPTDAELRALWREYTDLQVRWLILEIRALRKSLERIEDWYLYTDKKVANKGDLAGAQGQLYRLMHLLRAEMRRAGMR